MHLRSHSIADPVKPVDCQVSDTYHILARVTRVLRNVKSVIKTGGNIPINNSVSSSAQMFFDLNEPLNSCEDIAVKISQVWCLILYQFD